jgi:hypothetical protein
MEKKTNYMVTEEYMEHCMDEFYDIKHDELESKLQDFLDVEFNKGTYLDILLTYDLLINLCRGDYTEFFEKSKFEYISQLSLELSSEEIKELNKEYREYETPQLDEYDNGACITHCNYCGKPIFRDGEVRFIAEDGSYCYEDIKEVNDIYHTCIGKELLNCGYTEKDIMFMIGPDYNEYAEAINSGYSFESYNFDFYCENGDPMPEIFFTTAES